MPEHDLLVVPLGLATALLEHLQSHGFPNAQIVAANRGHAIEVSSGRMLIVDPDDWHSDAKAIVRGVIDRAKKGELDAVRFLMENSDFNFPSFKPNGEP